MNYTDERYNATSLFLDLATSGMLTIEEAVAQLKSESYRRTVWETVRRYSGLGDMDDRALRATLVDMLMAGNPENNPDSVRRKVSLWTGDDLYGIRRESAVELAFALGLTLPDAEDMIVRLCGEGFHWRDPKDIVFIYGLNNGLKYHETRALLRRMADRGLAPAEESKDRKDRAGKDACRPDEQADQRLVDDSVAKARGAMTSLVAGEVGLIQSEEELEQFLEQNGERLGEMHNTAYTLFIEYMNLLRQPTPQAGADPGKGRARGDRESVMSVEAILETYMFDRYIPKADDASDVARDALQRAIQSCLPNATTLSKMRTRKADVTRKVMILLFLACDGGDSAYGDLSEESPEDAFQDMFIRLDSMLIDCGFAPLDARSPFDWMVLYCMCSDDRLAIDDNVRRFLQSVFPPSERQEREEDGDDAE